jgi:hypothetical protein
VPSELTEKHRAHFSIKTSPSLAEEVSDRNFLSPMLRQSSKTKKMEEPIS